MATKRQKQQVYGWIDLWKDRWLLSHWTISVKFSDRPKPDADNTLADCSCNTEYLEAIITIYSPYWSDELTDRYREATVVHELAHIHTWALAALSARARSGFLVTQKEQNGVDEVTTEHIARALFRAYAGD
jgi:hypothetical protein